MRVSAKTMSLSFGVSLTGQATADSSFDGAGFELLNKILMPLIVSHTKLE